MDVYRYAFNAIAPTEEIESTLVLSLFAVEALHGECQTRLDAGHAFDPDHKLVVIDASTPVGRDLNRVFVGLVSREFGPGSFRVSRVSRGPQVETVAT